jgi:hypothetical protein
MGLPAGNCKYCSCTEDHACLIYTLLSGGHGVPCSWLNLARTCCTNPECMRKYRADLSVLRSLKPKCKEVYKSKALKPRRR